MAEMRGCDLVVEYLIKEKVPYMFGYAGHGAVGLLDGVYNHQDDIKIIFPRIESAAGYMADAYFRASGQVIPVYTSTGPGPMLLTVAMGNAFYDSSAFIAITGQVATNQYDSGALQEEYRHHQADFPSVAKVITKRSYQAQSVDDLGNSCPRRSSWRGPDAPALCTSTCRTTSGSAPPTWRCPWGHRRARPCWAAMATSYATSTISSSAASRVRRHRSMQPAVHSRWT